MQTLHLTLCDDLRWANKMSCKPKNDTPLTPCSVATYSGVLQLRGHREMGSVGTSFPAAEDICRRTPFLRWGDLVSPGGSIPAPSQPTCPRSDWLAMVQGWPVTLVMSRRLSSTRSDEGSSLCLFWGLLPFWQDGPARAEQCGYGGSRVHECAVGAENH